MRLGDYNVDVSSKQPYHDEYKVTFRPLADKRASVVTFIFSKTSIEDHIYTVTCTLGPLEGSEHEPPQPMHMTKLNQLNSIAWKLIDLQDMLT